MKKTILEGSAAALIPAIKSVANACADKKSSHEVFKCIHFKLDSANKQVMLEACNGAIMAQKIDYIQSCDVLNNFCVNSYDLLDNLKLCKEKYNDVFKIEYDDESRMFIFYVCEKVFMIKDNQLEYPNLSQVTVHNPANATEFHIAANVLEKLVKEAKSIGSNRVTIKAGAGTMKPIEYSIGYEEKLIKGIFMPVKEL